MKLVIIGAGSSYTIECMEGLLARRKTLKFDECIFVDIEEGRKRCEIVAGLARRMATRKQSEMKISTCYDRRKALENADFVLTQIRVGGSQARIQDERICNSLGLMGQETNGAGGMFCALRTIPVILDIVKDIQEICPQAFMINFTNPVGIIMEAISSQTTYKKAIGLCNIPIHSKMELARILNCDVNKVRMQLTGLNHFVYITNVWYEQTSVIEQVLKLSLDNPLENMRNIKSDVFSKAFIHSIKALPCSYHSYYYKTDEMLAHQLEDYQSNQTRGEKVKEIEEEIFKMYVDPLLDEKPALLEKRGGAYYSTAACDLMESIVQDAHDIQYVNIPNQKALPILDDEDIIETAAVITRQGCIPIAQPQPNRHMSGMIIQMKAFEKAVVEACVTHSKDKAIAALVLNPLVRDEKKASVVFDALWQAHQKYVGDYQEETINSTR